MPCISGSGFRWSSILGCARHLASFGIATNSRPHFSSHSAAKIPQTTPRESNSRPHLSSHSTGKVPQTASYSKTVVTKTVIGPNGQKTVTTEETVNSDGNGAAFNQVRFR